ncbi:MAG: hypothetical protein P8R42_27620 [Candidatus Binatia bacterium]|nr:hypothetical protein [Candidatus Binatia bacterium]
MSFLRVDVAAALLFFSPPARAADLRVAGRKLVILDGDLGGKDKVALVARGAEVTKGSGIDLGEISATVDIERGEAHGRFSIPAGPRGGGDDGWRQNDTSLARHQNPDAATSTAHLAVDVAWGTEDTLAPLRVSASGAAVHLLTALRPRADGEPLARSGFSQSGTVFEIRVPSGDTVVTPVS